jgi:hypothetical protein
VSTCGNEPLKAQTRWQQRQDFATINELVTDFPTAQLLLEAVIVTRSE